MKLSTVLIGAMMIAAASSSAQDKGHIKKVENDSVRVIKKLTAPSRTIHVKRKEPADSLKTTPQDSTKVIPVNISHDYCPPCGMG